MTYETISGDTWDTIAYKMYGKEVLADKIMAANWDLLDYMIFPAGILVQVPEIDASDKFDLPPWMEAG